VHCRIRQGDALKPVLSAADPADLLAWYDRHARRLPWRVGPAERAAGVHPDPYRVWLSEIMLQQTTVQAVKAYFDAFLLRWPRVEDLAAETVAREYGGRFPDSEEGLRTLPGIGAYTAAAIAAIAFDRPAVVVDGNVERVVSRLHVIETPLPASKPEIRARTAALTPSRRPGDFAQALMDLGATICTPKRPACGLCPWSASCLARQAGAAETYPRKAAKAARPVRTGTAFVAVREDGAVLLARRPDKGLLGGMTGVPGSEWAVRTAPVEPAWTPLDLAAAPMPAGWRSAGQVEHTFTHFHLALAVLTAKVGVSTAPPPGFWWSRPEDLPGEALPTVMRKAIEAALPGATRRQRP
jgi:A/G-specific adenine glycosylase